MGKRRPIREPQGELIVPADAQLRRAIACEHVEKAPNANQLNRSAPQIVRCCSNRRMPAWRAAVSACCGR